MRHILVPGNVTSAKSKKFKCEVCGCQWLSDEYKLDWDHYSLPAYDKCPSCKTEIYAVGTKKSADCSHVREKKR